MVGRLVLILPVHTWSRNIVNVGHPIDNCLLKSCCLKEMYLERKKNLKDVEMHSDQKEHLVLLEFPYIIKINKKRLVNKNSSILDGT